MATLPTYPTSDAEILILLNPYYEKCKGCRAYLHVTKTKEYFKQKGINQIPGGFCVSCIETMITMLNA